jgi:pimeloyl-ACP methyl ester carboxylesterase
MEKTTIDGLSVAYRVQGEGPAVLLLHGWPTSSYLWRGIAPVIARTHRVITVDLPGFGQSDKPLDRRYGFPLFGGVIDALLAHLEVDAVAIGAHDLGGPIAMHWALRNLDRVTGIALLNTFLFPELDPSAVAFVTDLTTPERRDKLTSRDGLAALFRSGLVDPAKATDEVIAAVTDPFPDEDSRRALALAGIGLSLRGLGEIATDLPTLECPLRIIYGEHDRLVPDVADIVARVQKNVPHAVVTALPYGHFLQEDAPDLVAGLLAEFYASLKTPA